MGHSPQKKLPLEVLIKRSQHLFRHEKESDLIKIAEENSPTEAAEKAKEITTVERIIQSTRWLAVAKRDYETKGFEAVIAANSK